MSRSPFKVAPYSFLTVREPVTKSRDGASFKKSARKSREIRRNEMFEDFLPKRVTQSFIFVGSVRF